MSDTTNVYHHNSSDIEKQMSERFPQWDNWKYIVRGLYFFQQCATVQLIAHVAQKNGSQPMLNMLADFARDYSLDYLQKGVFEERPFSQMKVYVWHMAAMQMMADYNMDGYHYTDMAKEIDNIKNVDNFSLGALVMDFDDLLKKVHQLSDDRQDMESQFQAQVCTQTVLLMEAGWQPMRKPSKEDFEDEVLKRLPADFDDVDAYQIMQSVFSADGKNYDPEMMAAFIHIYMSIVEIDSRISMLDFFTVRIREAARYIREHTKYLDNDADKPWDDHALWKMLSTEIRNTSWPHDDKAKEDIAHMFRTYATLEEQSCQPEIDEAGAITQFNGSVHPFHIENERAMERFAFLTTPIDMTKVIYPRLDESLDRW